MKNLKLKRDCLVICPVYNEGLTIKSFYNKLRKYYLDDVVFIDDGSQDESRFYLQKIQNERTYLIKHRKRYGYGQALITGFNFAIEYNYQRIITMDVDLQHNPEHLPRFIKELLFYDVVLGSRYIRIDKYLDVPRERMLINRYIAGLLRVIFNVNFSDPFCGFRAYRINFLIKTDLKEQSYGLGLEILMEIIKLNANFIEIPVEALYFNNNRKFLDGLDDPKKRLIYYIKVIERKRREIDYEKVFLNYKSSSR